jgi:hypothetical protein
VNKNLQGCEEVKTHTLIDAVLTGSAASTLFVAVLLLSVGNSQKRQVSGPVELSQGVRGSCSGLLVLLTLIILVIETGWSGYGVYLFLLSPLKLNGLSADCAFAVDAGRVSHVLWLIFSGVLALGAIFLCCLQCASDPVREPGEEGWKFRDGPTAHAPLLTPDDEVDEG